MTPSSLWRLWRLRLQLGCTPDGSLRSSHSGCYSLASSRIEILPWAARLAHSVQQNWPDIHVIHSSIHAYMYIIPVHYIRYPYNLFDILHQENSRVPPKEYAILVYIGCVSHIRGWFAPSAKPGDTISNLCIHIIYAAGYRIITQFNIGSKHIWTYIILYIYIQYMHISYP